MGTIFWISALLVLLLIVGAALVRYDDSEKFRYRFKFSFYVFYVSFVCLISIPFTAVRPRSVENMAIISPLIRFASKLLGVSWEVHGTEFLSSDKSCVIVCNHQSILDTLGMAEAWRVMRRCATVAKKELVFVFPFGLVAWLCGTVFIDRSKGAKSISKLSTTADSIRKSGTKLWIFPEGTRHKAEELLPFKKGAFHIALEYELPIVPVVISPYTFINDEKETFGHGKVVMSILPPISTKDVRDVNDLVMSTRDLMNAEFQRLSKQVYSESSKEVYSNGAVLSSEKETPPVVEAKKSL